MNVSVVAGWTVHRPTSSQVQCSRLLRPWAGSLEERITPGGPELTGLGHREIRFAGRFAEPTDLRSAHEGLQFSMSRKMDFLIKQRNQN